MPNCKRALTLVLGLFFFLFIFSLLAADEDANTRLIDDLSFSAGTGTLWVEEGGGAGFWHSGVSIKKEKKWYADFGLGQVLSNLPWAEGSVFGFLGKFGFDTSLAGINIASGFFNHTPFNMETENFSLYNDGGEGFFFAFGTPLHIGDLDIEPSFLFGKGVWDNGSLYWFFGKPDVPALGIYGLSARYKRHAVAFHYFSMDIEILDDEDVLLFDSCIEAYALYYKYSLERTNIRFAGTLGWFYASAAASGALTSSNQHYWLFPFLFYNVSASIDFHAGFAMLDAKYKHSIFQYSLGLGAAHVFHGKGIADLHYKWKKLFGDEEAFENMPIEAGGVGAAFMLLDAGIPALRINREKNMRVSLGLQKVFAIPWGYEQFLPEDAVSPGSSTPSWDDIASRIMTILFSGLSFYCSLSL